VLPYVYPESLGTLADCRLSLAMAWLWPGISPRLSLDYETQMAVPTQEARVMNKVSSPVPGTQDWSPASPGGWRVVD
jgi:hypothetical protein